MIEITLKGDDLVIAELTSLPGRLQTELVRAITSLSVNLRDLVQSEYLSGPTGEHTLSRISGDLARSVNEDVEVESGESVTGRVFYNGDVVYAAIHEFGGVIHVPEIVATHAQALHFVLDGKDVFAKKVAAHDVHMPERAPLRTAFHAFEPEIHQELEAAISRAIN